MAERERERERSKSLRRFVICVFLTLLVAVLASGIFIKCKYFSHKLPTKSIKLEDIKSVQIINLDRAKERREHYEKMLRDNFGDTFIGHKIGDEIRLPAVDGKKELIFEDIHTGKRVMYNDIAEKIGYFDYGIYKVSSIKDKKLSFVWEKDGFEAYGKYVPININVGYLGCMMSHFKALQKIASQPDGTYGLVLEDDFALNKNFDKIFSEILKSVPKDFDIIKLGPNIQAQILCKNKICKNKYGFLNVIKKSFRKYGYGKYANAEFSKNERYRTGAVAQLISKEGAVKILEYYKQLLSYRTSDVDFYYYLPRQGIINSYYYLDSMPFLFDEEMNDTSSIREKKRNDRLKLIKAK